MYTCTCTSAPNNLVVFRRPFPAKSTGTNGESGKLIKAYLLPRFIKCLNYNKIQVCTCDERLKANEYTIKQNGCS